MITLLSPNFVPLEVNQGDLVIALIAFGFTIGFGFLTTWTAIQQTIIIKRRYTQSKEVSPYVWMIWLEILACCIFAIICILHLLAIIPPSFAFFFCILTTWSLQVQFLLQIIINRISILLTNRRKALNIKIGVAVFITAINVSVYNIWIPARLQISERYIYINSIWDRCEKVIFLIIDALLNWYFIHTVRKNLVQRGLTKYDALVRFNVSIVGISLAMDCLIIGMMSLKNSFVYMQIHPLAYIVKLNIEISMTELMARVATSNDGNLAISENIFIDTPAMVRARSTALHNKISSNPRKHINIQVKSMDEINDMAMKLSTTFGATSNVKWAANSDPKLDGVFGRSTSGDRDIAMHMRREVNVVVERRNSLAPSFKHRRGSDGTEGSIPHTPIGQGNIGDERVLLEKQRSMDSTIEREREKERERQIDSQRMGVYTTVWAMSDDDN